MTASRRKPTQSSFVDIIVVNTKLANVIKLARKEILTNEEINRICLHIQNYVNSDSPEEKVQYELMTIYLKTIGKSANYELIKKFITDAVNTKKLAKPITEYLYLNALLFGLKHNALESDFRRLEIYYQLYIDSPNMLLKIHEAFGVHYNEENAFAKSLKSSLAMSRLNDINAQVLGHYNSGHAYKNLADYKNAIEHFMQVIKIYHANPKSPDVKHYLNDIGKAAHNCAKLLDNDEGDLTPEPDLALYYYRIGAKFHNMYCLHDLGYKYENGEDVQRNFKAALVYYEKAVRLENIDSLINLFVLKNKLKADSSVELLQLENNQNNANVRRTLFCYYIRKYIDTLENDSTNQLLLDEVGKQAFELVIANKHVDPYALHNLGLCYLYGIGVECNEHLAEQYLTESVVQGFHHSKDQLLYLYLQKLIGIKPILAFKNVDDDETKDDSYLNMKMFEKIKLGFKEMGDFAEYDLIQSIDNTEATLQHKIKDILNYNVALLNVDSLVKVIHQLGYLTERSLNYRHFHNNQLADILPFITEINKRLVLHHFNYEHIANLIEGLSKLYLQKNVFQLEALLVKLYQEALHLDTMNDANLSVKIIYAATRLDVNHIVIRDILPLLNAKIDFENLSPFAFAKYYYAQAILSCSLPQLLTDDGIKQLYECSKKNIKRFNRNDEIILRQHATAIHYFHANEPSELKNKLSHITQSLDNQVQPDDVTTTSELQINVVQFLGQYFEHYKEEVLVNTFTVDAIFSLNENESFILQVDGPSHFLHAPDVDPKPTQKTLFRNAIISKASPVICVSYLKWDQCKTASEKAEYLTELLNEIGVELKSKWIVKTTQPRSYLWKSVSQSNTQEPVSQSLSSNSGLISMATGKKL